MEGLEGEICGIPHPHERSLQIYLRMIWSWSFLLLLQCFQACDSQQSVCRDALSTDFHCSCLRCQGPTLPDCWISRWFPCRKQTGLIPRNNSYHKKSATITYDKIILVMVYRINKAQNVYIFINMHSAFCCHSQSFLTPCNLHITVT